MYNMYDKYGHPKQEQLNEALGKCLAETVKRLQIISNAYDVDAKSLADYFEDCFRMLKNQTFTKE